MRSYLQVCEMRKITLPSELVVEPIADAVVYLFDAEGLTAPIPPYSETLRGTLEGARYRDNLLSLYRRLSNKLGTYEALLEPLLRAAVAFTEHLPPIDRA